MKGFNHLSAYRQAYWLNGRRARTHLDLHGARGQSRDLFLHAVGDARIHGGTAGQHVVGVQVFADVNVTLHDAVVGRLVDSSRLHT